jgi:hypothetical protein
MKHGVLCQVPLSQARFEGFSIWSKGKYPVSTFQKEDDEQGIP